MTGLRRPAVARAPNLVVGVGVASAATTGEVAALVAAALAEAGASAADVCRVATVEARRRHPAVVALSRPVIAFSRERLAAAHRAGTGTGAAGVRLRRDDGTGRGPGPGPGDGGRDAGRPGRAGPAPRPPRYPPVAETAALLAAGPDAVLVVPKRRSQRATVALARAHGPGRRRE